MVFNSNGANDFKILIHYQNKSGFTQLIRPIPPENTGRTIITWQILHIRKF
ncbi:hypothetical protein FHU12_2325 [Serratia marcescens]|uniref:Uncharacterized protein n=1 Tax=Serratia marcescens TaxID=615 RepID=A0AA46K531_SERMA|nr:hypothetical protein FHU12_2325 [Serratia marcescens]